MPSARPLAASLRASPPIRALARNRSLRRSFGIEEQAYSGFGPTDDRLHTPDEYIRIEDYLNGAACVACLLDEYPRAKAESEKA